MEDQPASLSYLLRLWQTRRGGRQVWWASLEAPGTRQRRGFTRLEDLFIYLKDLTEEVNLSRSGEEADESLG